MFFDFDPTELAPDLAAIKQREQLRAQLARLEGKEGATDDNKAEIKELKKLLAEQKKDQDKQKEIQNLLYEVSTELKDLDQRLEEDDQFEAAAKEFIDLYKRTNLEWILDHKNYDSLDFKELANKTGELYGALIKIPKLKPQIEEAESWLELKAEKKAKEEEESWIQHEAEKRAKEAENWAREAKNRARETKNRAREAKKDAWLEEEDKRKKTKRRVIHYPLWFISIFTVSAFAGGDAGGLMLVLGWIPCWLLANYLSNRPV